jgi:hypothetical protein
MSRNNRFHNPEGACFVSFTVAEWIDVFTTNEIDLKFLPHERIRAAAGRAAEEIQRQGMDRNAWIR